MRCKMIMENNVPRCEIPMGESQKLAVGLLRLDESTTRFIRVGNKHE